MKTVHSATQEWIKTLLAEDLKKTRLYILIFLAVIAGSVLLPESAKSTSRRDKARYYYLLGVERDAMEDQAGAYEYFRRAAETDTDYLEAVYLYNEMRMRLRSDSVTLDDATKSLAKVRKYVDAYPGDYNEARYYAYLAGNIFQPAEAVDVLKMLGTVYPSKTELLLELADAYIKTDSLNGALAALDRYEKAEGKSPDISVRKISYMLALNDTVNALAEARNMAAENPRIAEYQLTEGHVYSYLKDNESALKSYLRALEIDPEDPSSMLSIASVYAAEGDSVKYDDMIYKVLLSERLTLDSKLELLGKYVVGLYVNKSYLPRADNLFSVLREQYPHEPDVLDFSSEYSAAKENWEDAIEEISYAIDLRPEKTEYWNRLMSYQMAANKPKDALTTFNRMLEKDIAPEYGTKYLQATAYSLSGDYDNAIKHYEKLIHEYVAELNPTDSVLDRKPLTRLDASTLETVSDLLCGIGDAYNLKGDTVTAFKVYDNALIANPYNSLALNNYAYYLSLRNENLERALEMSRQSLDISPDNPTFLDTYAWIQFKLKNFEEAKKYQSAAIEKTPETDASEELYSHYGDILFMAGEPEEAVIYWKKALELAPDNALLKKKVKNKAYYYE